MTVSMSGPVPDAVRTAYLSAMGVPLFRARHVLPGAAPSRPVPAVDVALPVTALTDAPLPDLPMAPVPVSATAAIAPLPETLPQRMRPDLPPAAATTPAPAVSLPVPASAPADAADAGTVPRFSCQLFRLAEGHWALVDLDDHPALEGLERQLWQGIQRAMAWQAEAVASAFVWPRSVTPSSLFLAPDAESARAVMTSWLQRDVPAGERLWVFGDQLAPFVDRPHRVVPALTACLRDPMRKRLLWRQLSRGD